MQELPGILGELMLLSAMACLYLEPRMRMLAAECADLEAHLSRQLCSFNDAQLWELTEQAWQHHFSSLYYEELFLNFRTLEERRQRFKKTEAALCRTFTWGVFFCAIVTVITLLAIGQWIEVSGCYPLVFLTLIFLHFLQKENPELHASDDR